MPRLFRFLEGLIPQGQTDLNKSIAQYNVKPRRPGLAILISDLLTATGFESGMRNMLGRGSEAALIHVLSPDELEPSLAGDLQLVDMETDTTQDVSLDGSLRREYRARVQSWIQSTQDDCRKQNIRYLNLTTNMPWDQALLLEMRHAGVVK
jgi:hypothetical protein